MFAQCWGTRVFVGQLGRIRLAAGPLMGVRAVHQQRVAKLVPCPAQLARVAACQLQQVVETSPQESVCCLSACISISYGANHCLPQ